MTLPGSDGGLELRAAQEGLGIAIAFLSPTTGVNSIMYLSLSVLIATGLDTQAPWPTISNGLVSGDSVRPATLAR